MGKIIILISSKGGCGKSTVAVGVATALSLSGKRVLLIDADEGARCLDTLLSVNSDTVFDLSDVLNGNASVEEAALPVPKLTGVSVIPSPGRAEPTDFTVLKNFIETVSTQYDFVLVDTKGQLSAERLSLLPKDATFVSVVTTDDIAVKNTGVLTAGLMNYGIRCRLIINRFKKYKANGRIANIDNVIDDCGAQLIGIIPEDMQIGLSGHGPIVFGKAAAALNRISSRLVGDNTPLPKISEIL